MRVCLNSFMNVADMQNKANTEHGFIKMKCVCILEKNSDKWCDAINL